VGLGAQDETLEEPTVALKPMVEPWRALVTEYLGLATVAGCATDDENLTQTTQHHHQSVSEEEEAATLPSTLRRR
jgi:hypothetical protein